MDGRRKVSRMTKPFDLLAEFGKFGLEHQLSLRDPATISAFIGDVRERVEGALGDSPLVYGQRTEAMFEALLVSLGEFELLKAEDTGRLFPDDRYNIPDFRVVLKDGSHWLIEVKNVHEPNPSRQRRRLFSGPRLKRLTAYADATGAELKIAVFWARWSIWTLVTPGPLTGADGGLDLDLWTAYPVNELSSLGDRTIGTRPPLRLYLAMDQARTSRVDANGKVKLAISDVRIFCGDQELLEADDKEIAWFFIQYGDWQVRDPKPILDGDRLVAIELRWEPVEQTNQGFEFVGTLSRMFAAYYAEQSVKSGEVVQIRAPLRRDWLEPLVRLRASGRALPLWSFVQKPNSEPPLGLV